MKKKSVITLLLVVFMLLSIILPGCSKDNDKVSSDDVTDEQGNSIDEKDDTAEGDSEGDAPAEREEVEISAALWDFVEYGDDVIGETINDKLNIKITPVPLGWDNDVEQIKLFAATDELPDIVSTYTVDDPARFYSWIEQGLTRAIPEEMFQKYSNLREVFENSIVCNAVKEITGEYRYIPRPGSQKNIYIASQQVLYYRKDWLENVGIKEVPETIDEFYEMLRAFKEDDPDQDGQPNTYGFTVAGLGSAIPIFAVYGINPESWVQDEDGKWIPGYISKDCIEPLEFLQKLYKEGLMDPEFSTIGWKQAVQKFTSNTFGCLIRNGDTHWLNKTINSMYGEANEDVEDPLEIIGVMPPLKKDADNKPQWPLFIDAGGSEINSNVDDEKLDRILELYDFLLSEEGKMLIRYGIEGEHYKKTGDKIELIDNPETGEPYKMSVDFPSVAVGMLAHWDWDNDVDPNSLVDIPDAYKELGNTVRDMYNPAALDENLAVRYISTPTKNDLTINFRDSFTQMVIEDEDIETAFQKFIDECMNKGLDKAIDEVNEFVEENDIK